MSRFVLAVVGAVLLSFSVQGVSAQTVPEISITGGGN